MKRNNLKAKSISSITVSNEQFLAVIRMGIQIYPVYQKNKWFIQVNNNGKITTYDKPISQNEINDSINKTIIHFYNQIKLKENGNK